MQVAHVCEFDLSGVLINAVNKCAHHGSQVFSILVTFIGEGDGLSLLLTILLIVHPQLIVKLLQSLLALCSLHLIGFLDLD